MWAICKREIQSYFFSPIGYVFIAMFMLICGILFFASNIATSNPTSDYVSTLQSMTIFFSFIVPILTMRSFSDERKTKTDQLLLTAPIKISHVVLGKYIATLFVLMVTLLLNTVYPIILAIYGSPDAARILASYVGFFLMGATFMSIGLLISSLTESQVVAAISTFAVAFAFWLGSNALSAIDVPFIQTIVSALSIYDRYSSFSEGIIGFSPVIYYISLSGLFLFLTVRVIERRRWIGA